MRKFEKKFCFMSLALVSVATLEGCVKKTEKSGVAGAKKILKDNLDVCLTSLRKERSFEKNPAVIKINDRSKEVVFIGDVHGSFDSLLFLLKASSLVEIDSNKKVTWVAKNTILVQSGDSINKNKNAGKVIDLYNDLENQLSDGKLGSSIYTLAGNHETGFLFNFSDKKYEDFFGELKDLAKDNGDGEASGSLAGCEALAPELKSKLAWITQRPAAALVNGVYVSHSGYIPKDSSVDTIASSYESFIKSIEKSEDIYVDTPFPCGDGDDKGGFFNRNIWWVNKEGEVSQNKFEKKLKSVGASQIVFGHDPGAFESKDKREVAGYFKNKEINSALIKIDTAMWEWESGAGVRVKSETKSKNSEASKNPDYRGYALRCNKWDETLGGCKKFEVLGFEKFSNSEMKPFEPRELEIKENPPRKKPADHDGC